MNRHSFLGVSKNWMVLATLLCASSVAHAIPIIIGPITATPISCAGATDGSLIVSFSGGTGMDPFIADVILTTPPHTEVAAYGTITGGVTTITIPGLGTGSYNVTITNQVIGGETATTQVPVLVPNATPVVVTPNSATAPSCFGASTGSATVTVMGGTGKYSVQLIASSGDYKSPIFAAIAGVPVQFTGLAVGTYTAVAIDSNNCENSAPVTVPASGTALVVNFVTVTNETCVGLQNGTISVAASGGTGTLLYSIDGGANYFANDGIFTGVLPGTYSVVVKDTNGCTTTPIAETVLAATPIGAQVSATPPTCTGGSDGTVGVTITGGTPPFVLTLTPALSTTPVKQLFGAPNGDQRTFTFVGVPAGTYSLNISDANHCAITELAVIVPTASNFFIQSVNITPISCSGSSDATITVNVVGGRTPLTYSLDGIRTSSNNVFTGVGPGTHTIVVTDSSSPACSVTFVTAPIVNPSALTATVTATQVVCFGSSTGSIIVTPAGGTPPYSFSFDGGRTFGAFNQLNNVPAGIYSIEVKDSSGCLYQTTATIGQLSQLSFATINTTNVSCFGGSNGQITLTATGGTAPYVFSIDGGFTFSSNNVFFGLLANTYIIAVKDANGCVTMGKATITQPPLLTVQAVAFPVTNRTGRIVVLANGGIPPYMYSINGGVTFVPGNAFSVKSGSYSVVVQDANGCNATTTASVFTRC